MSRRNQRTRAVPFAFAITLCLLAAGCNQEWSQSRWDPGLTNANTTETAITAATISSVTTRFTVSAQARQTAVQGSHLFGTFGSTLWAADATGSSGCSGSPTTCATTWTADVGATPFSWLGTIAGTVLTTRTVGADTGIAAFDSRGTTGCSGHPVLCTPVWSTTDHSAVAANLAGSRLYVVHNQPSELRVYDATGTTGCGGTPRRCTPLWTAPLDQTAPGTPAPAVAADHVFVATTTGFAAFDANGTDNCFGTPAVCTPQWTTILADDGFPAGGGARSITATVDAVVTVRNQPAGDSTVLNVSSARGTTNCSGQPVRCTPMWAASLQYALAGRPAVADGRVIVQHGFLGSRGVSGSVVSAFDLAGHTGCDGSPVQCTELWRQGSGDVSPAGGIADVTIVRDLVFTTHDLGFSFQIDALNASNGAVVWSNTASPLFPPIVSEGRLYLQTMSNVEVLALA